MRAKKVDTTHGEIRDHLRAVGWSVRSTAVIGGDFPDLAVARAGFTALVECKSCGRFLTTGQTEFKRFWPGVVVTARSGTEAEKLLNQAWSLQRIGGAFEP